MHLMLPFCEFRLMLATATVRAQRCLGQSDTVATHCCCRMHQAKFRELEYSATTRRLRGFLSVLCSGTFFVSNPYLGSWQDHVFFFFLDV